MVDPKPDCGLGVQRPYPCLAPARDGFSCEEPAVYVVTVAAKLDGERDVTLRCAHHRDVINVHFDIVGHVTIQ